jgi:hypothetical protein
MDIKFLSNLSQNDTLQRRKRDQQINNHLKQYQQLSSDDEHDLLLNANPSQPVVVDIYIVYFDLFYFIFRLLFHQNK